MSGNEVLASGIRDFTLELAFSYKYSVADTPYTINYTRDVPLKVAII